MGIKYYGLKKRVSGLWSLLRKVLGGYYVFA
jgi:hypothetical protein